MELAFEKCGHIFLVLADLITFQQFSILLTPIALWFMVSRVFFFPLLRQKYRSARLTCCHGINESSLVKKISNVLTNASNAVVV